MLHMSRDNIDNNSRRNFLLKSTLPFAALTLGNREAFASSLLEDFGGTDFKNFEVKKVEEATVAKGVSKGEGGIDPTLKGSYYYPTAKKRYVPRIIRVSENISAVPGQIESADWDAVSSFANKVADDAVLPMKLYQSSLDGQGLNMKNDYVSVMKDKANLFEQKTRDLQKAVKAQNKEKALVALNGINEAITEYRVAGRLSDADGNIPSVEDMRRGAMRRPVVVANK